MKKTFLFVILAASVLVFGTWSFVYAMSIPPAKGQVSVTAGADKNEDSIEMKITIVNGTETDAVIENSSGQKFDFELLDADKNPLYRWSADKSFIQILTSIEIKAGETLELGDILSGDVYTAIKDKIVYLKAYIVGEADFLNPDGYEVKLK